MTPFARRRWGVAAVCALVAFASAAQAQELEPRSYTAAPVGTNFAIVTFSDSRGEVNLDSSLPLSDVRASVNAASLGFSQTFGWLGNAGNWSVAVPYLGAHVNGQLSGQAEEVARYGFPDVRARFAMNVWGPALTPQQFARRKRSTTVGVSLTVIGPTGTYDPTRLINIGSNRWSFKPEIGLEQPLGKWFADASAGLWVFGKNTDYYGGHVLVQAPLSIYQAHLGYNFRESQWLAANINYYSAGATSVSGATPLNSLANSRYGLTYSQPFVTGVSAKLAWSHWLNGRYGQDFSTTNLTFQYRWFDRR